MFSFLIFSSPTNLRTQLFYYVQCHFNIVNIHILHNLEN